MTRAREAFDRIKRAVDPPPPPKTYADWVRLYDTLDDAKRAEARKAIEAFPKKPLVSIVVPTHNTPEAFLRAMIESVRAQLYTNWELCIADDVSTDPKVREVLTEYAAKDDRIKVVFCETHGHISKTSNAAIALANGEWIALLDHDDVLPEHALFMVVRYIHRFPKARLLYSDEDKLGFEGQRCDPYFKGDWNPELARGQNMFSHLGVFETALLREVGGFREGFEGSQDHDLILRCVDRAGPDAVVHVPHVLYHWRMLRGSAAIGVDEKPYVRMATTRAIRDHLDRNREPGLVTVSIDYTNMMRVRYPVPEPAPLVSIVVASRARARETRRCVESVLARTRYASYEILVVDNGSVDGFEDLSMHPNVRILRGEYRSYSFPALVNRGAGEAKGTFLCCLDDDVEIISADWLHELVSHAARPGVGAVGPALWYPHDALQNGGMIVGVGAFAGVEHYGLPRRSHEGYLGRTMLTHDVTAVSGSGMVVEKALFDSVGGLNETDLVNAFHDIDLCLRIRKAGRRVLYAAHADVRHHDGSRAPGSWGRFWREAQWMKQTWGRAVEVDPFYNPNLSDDTDRTYDPAYPPRIGMFD